MATRKRQVQSLSADEEAFLRAFARVVQVVPRALEADLLREQRLSLSEYFVLVHLSEAPGRRMRMSELAGAAAMSLSGMTRIVSRLAAEGFVDRERCAADGRGWNAVLTPTGLARLRGAWPAHLVSTRRRLFAHLDGIDLVAATEALQRMAESCDGAGAALGERSNGAD